MKSAIFESLNDRSNIANAYFKMVNEANEVREQEIAELAKLFEDKECPLCIYDDTKDPQSNIIDLFDIETKYNKDMAYFENGTDDYYIALAFNYLTLDEIYKKLLEIDGEYRLNPTELYMMNGDCVKTMDELLSDIADIGRDLLNEWHKDDVAVKIPEWAVSYLEYNDPSGLEEDDVKMVDKYVDDIVSKGYRLVYDGENLGFCPYPEFGLASDCVRYYLEKETNESIERSFDHENDENGWFNEKGNLIKKLPRVCIIECSKPGEDAYLKCLDWVNKLPYFVDSLDIPLAKGYLKSTGGWEDDEIASFNNEKTAICILWLIANDIKNGIPYPSISYGNFYKDIFSNTVTESRCHNHKVILTNIQWPDGAYDENMDIPGKDSMVIEVGDGENIRKVIDNVYIDSYGFAPVNFHIARNVDLGFVDVDDSKSRRKKAKNEMVSQSDLDKLKKKNPKLKDISEEK